MINPHVLLANLEGTIGTVSGFGWTSVTAGTGSNELRFINVIIVSDALCQNAVGVGFNDTVLCTGTTSGTGTW